MSNRQAFNEHIKGLFFNKKGKLNAEVDTSLFFSLKVRKYEHKLKSFLDIKVDNEPQQAAPSPNTANVKMRVDLLKLVLKKFRGIR